MSVFSKLKFAKRAAEEQKAKAKENEKKGKDVAKEKYKHIPRHAAIDALSGAPSSWKHEDKPKIKEHHQRRSQMYMSRTGSAVSTQTGESSTQPGSTVPRNSSYSSYNPTWWDRGDNLYRNELHHKRSKPSRVRSFPDSGIGPSPLVSQVTSKDVSPLSSSNSSLSSNIEMPPAKKRQPQASVYGENDIFERLHKNKTRKVGEAPVLTSPPQSSVAPSIASMPASETGKKRFAFKGKSRSIAIAV